LGTVYLFIVSQYYLVKNVSLILGYSGIQSQTDETQVVSSIIYGIRDIKASEFVTDHPGKDHPYGFDSPSLRVVMRNNVGKKYELVVGSKKDKKYYVKRDDENSVY